MAPESQASGQRPDNRGMALLLKALYWLAVLVVSVALLIGLILLLESRDSSSVGGFIRLALPG